MLNACQWLLHHFRSTFIRYLIHFILVVIVIIIINAAHPCQAEDHGQVSPSTLFLGKFSNLLKVYSIAVCKLQCVLHILYSNIIFLYNPHLLLVNEFHKSSCLVIWRCAQFSNLNLLHLASGSFVTSHSLLSWELLIKILPTCFLLYLFVFHPISMSWVKSRFVIGFATLSTY